MSTDSSAATRQPPTLPPAPSRVRSPGRASFAASPSVPDDMVRRCESQHRDLLDHVLAYCDAAEGADVVYALAAHARLSTHRSELMRSIA